MILKATEANIKKAAGIIKAGGVVAFPTETVYGLGADALNEAAVARIFEIKGRPSINPLIVHLAEVDGIADVAEISNSLLRSKIEKISGFWPGPLTLVLPKLEIIPGNVCANLSSIAVRIPSHPVARALLRFAATPIAAPSANTSNYVSPTTAEHVEANLGDKVEIILDGGACEVGLESTILSLIHAPPRILRAGRITLEMLSEVLGEVQYQSDGEIIAPGMMKKHYAPRTKVAWLKDFDLSKAPERVGLISFGKDLPGSSFIAQRTLSPNSNLEQVAHNLFAALRELDNLGLDLILVDSCERRGLGLAIMDRIERAIQS